MLYHPTYTVCLLHYSFSLHFFDKVNHRVHIWERLYHELGSKQSVNTLHGHVWWYKAIHNKLFTSWRWTNKSCTRAGKIITIRRSMSLMTYVTFNNQNQRPQTHHRKKPNSDILSCFEICSAKSYSVLVLLRLLYREISVVDTNQNTNISMPMLR